jgi:hypothetical protein
LDPTLEHVLDTSHGSNRAIFFPMEARDLFALMLSVSNLPVDTHFFAPHGKNQVICFTAFM